MRIFKLLYGKILQSLANIVEAGLGVLINISELIIGLVKSIGKGLLSLVSIGGILFFFIGPRLLLNPTITLTIISILVIPVLGSIFVSFLKYIKYTITEYLFDYSDYFLNGKKVQFQTFSEYGRKYRKVAEDKKRKEQETRQKSQQKEWEERFRQWSEYQSSHKNSSYRGYNWGGQNYGNGNHTYINPNIGFKDKYEKSCDLLGIDYASDKYEIKLAYRKKAKEFHPDINKAPDATQKFQEINDAYEFLSDINIERYKRAS